MSSLKMEASKLGPAIELKETGVIKISGQSMMEDAADFYAPIHDWINDQISRKGSWLIEFDLIYFNSSSAKQLLKLLMTIDETDQGCKVTWNYPKGNDILMERGEEFAIMLDLKFDFVEK